MTRPQGLPAGLVAYKRTAIFDESTMPAGLRRGHRTKDGVWGLIRVLDGRLRYRILEPLSEEILDSERYGVVWPAQSHEVEPIGAVRFFVEFYAEPATVAAQDALRPGKGDGIHD